MPLQKENRLLKPIEALPFHCEVDLAKGFTGDGSKRCRRHRHPSLGFHERSRAVRVRRGSCIATPVNWCCPLDR